MYFYEFGEATDLEKRLYNAKEVVSLNRKAVETYNIPQQQLAVVNALCDYISSRTIILKIQRTELPYFDKNQNEQYNQNKQQLNTIWQYYRNNYSTDYFYYRLMHNHIYKDFITRSGSND